MAAAQVHTIQDQCLFNNSTALPQCWYPAMRSHELKAGKIRKVELHDRAIVIYRTADSSVIALDGQCPHMGANLAHGCVQGNKLQCAFHHLLIEPDGSYLQAAKPGSVRSYPTVEKWGTIWIFNGPYPLFELPEPANDDADLRCFYIGTTSFSCHPHVIAANAFDMSHLDKLHGIRLTAPPIVSEPSPYHITVEWRGRGASLADQDSAGLAGQNNLHRLAKRMSGEVHVKNSILGSLITWIQILEPFNYQVLYGRRPMRRSDGRIGAKTQTFLFASLKTLFDPGFISTLGAHTKVLLEDRKLLSDIQFNPHFLPSDSAIEALYRHTNRQEAY